MFNRLTNAVPLQLLAACLVLSGAAFAQTAGTIQTLDRVDVSSLTSVLEMQFEDPDRTVDFIDTGISGTDFRACKLTALSGLYCLDGKKVRNWPNPADPTVNYEIIDCENRALALDTNKDETCTALTVDLSGTIWLAGKNKKGPTFVLYRIVQSEATDCGDSILLNGGDGKPYCAKLVASDKPLLIDLNPVDGDVAAAFPLGAGVLYLEERKTAVFQPANESTATVIASGRKGWGLAGNEQLQSIALWQSPDGEDNRILVTTDRGRVLAVSIEAAGTEGAPPVVGDPRLAFDVPSARASDAEQCEFERDPQYGIRTSSKSGLVYLTDRQYCDALALRAELVPESSPDAGTTLVLTEEIALSTNAGTPESTFPPEGPTVAPGIGIDLTTCADNCTLIAGAAGPAAQLFNVTVDPNGPSGLTLFQVKGIPDCRYIPAVCEDLLGVADLAAAKVVIPLDENDADNPAAQRLNMTPLLPKEITDLFVGDNVLPPMYMSRFTRGQRARGFTFEAFFGVTEDGVVFLGTYDGELEVGELVGGSPDFELGCAETHLPETDVTTILQWDTISTVSERYFGSDGETNVDRLTNVDCGSSKFSDGRWSLKPYNTEITPCTWNADDPVWNSDGRCSFEQGEEVVDDAVFAKLLLSLVKDLGDAITNTACQNVDGGNAPLLGTADCLEVESIWANSYDKLARCWDATQQPKQSAGDQNCQSFVSQLTNLEAYLATNVAPFVPDGTDPANRLGELQARIATIWHVYEDRFVPSIPAEGFVEPQLLPPLP